MAIDLTGRTLGPFFIEGHLGQGAMGTVYRARHVKTGKAAAIKVMLEQITQSPNLAARFEREISILSQFRHPHIVRIYGSSVQDGIRYYAMEMIVGQSLDDIMDREDRLSCSQTAALMIQLCDALQKVHENGIIHRDLKPGNVMVTGDGTVKLTDFGIAKDVSSLHDTRLTRADQTVGTVAYMSPEQLTGSDLTPRSDLYSLGILIYQLLTGRLPFEGDTVYEYLQQRVGNQFSPPSDLDHSIPLEMDYIVRDLLKPLPSDRPRDAYMVMQRLIEIQKKESEGTLTRTSKAESSDWRADTVPINTVNPSKASTLTSSAVRKRGGSRNRRPQPPAMGPILGMGGGLLAILVFAAYMLWPDSAETSFRKGSALMSGDAIDMKRAFDKYFDPLLKRDPQSPHAEEIAKFQVILQREQARGIARRMARRSEATEAERLFLDALAMEKQGQTGVAMDRYRAIVDAFASNPSERGWVALATEKLEQSSVADSNDERLATKRNQVTESLAEITLLQQGGKLAEALQKYLALEALYQDDAEIADLLEEVAGRVLPPEELVARGERLMANADPKAWQRANRAYFQPVMMRYPMNAMADTISRHQDRIREYEARRTLEAALLNGMPADISPAARQVIVAVAARDRLGDAVNADAWLRQVADETPTAQEPSELRSWRLLARSLLGSSSTPVDTGARLAAAEAAATKLHAMRNNDRPATASLAAAITNAYLADEATRPAFANDPPAR